MKELAQEETSKNRLLSRIRNGENLSNQEILQEIKVMKSLQHPNLVHLKEIIREIQPPHTMFIIMEYVKLGNIMRIGSTTAENGLAKFVCPLTGGVMGEALASKCFRGVCNGMKYLHANRVAHRDLKMENILLDDKSNVRIADFGVSHIFSENDSLGHVTDTKGTMPYWSPEMCDSESDASYSAYKADVWAAGVCLWIFIYGTMPFWGQEIGELFAKVTAGPPEKPHRVSTELEEMLNAVLDLDPDRRPSFKQCLTKDFIVFHDTNEVTAALDGDSPISPRFSLEVKKEEDGDLDLRDVITGGHVHINRLYAANLKSWVDRAKESAAKKKAEIDNQAHNVVKAAISKFENNKSMKENESDEDDLSDDDNREGQKVEGARIPLDTRVSMTEMPAGCCRQS